MIVVLAGLRVTAATCVLLCAPNGVEYVEPIQDTENLQGTNAATSTNNVWDTLAECESNGDWHINTGNGYYGGLQFHPNTWTAYAPPEYPSYAHRATREQQITVAERVLDEQGWEAWPACSRKLGLR